MVTEVRPVVGVSRTDFDEGCAECVICGAYVKPVGEMTQMLVRRKLGSDTAAGECSVCDLITYFALTS